MNLPKAYIDNINVLLEKDAEQYFESFGFPSYKGLRVNTSKISCKEFEEICPFHIEKIPFISNGYYYNDDENVTKNPLYFAGLYYIQEPSAMLPANRLEINSDDRVLDLCAAPGGKATELLSKLNGTGILYANDYSASRAKALLKNLEMTGKGNFYVTAEEPSKLAKNLKGFFNKILVDAPCSGEGMFRKDSSLINSWMEKGPEYYSGIQKEILDSAYEMLMPGGLLMYSTCTFSKLEDEDNIRYLLDKYGDLHLEDIEMDEGFLSGYDGLDKCVRIFPHRVKGEGHFLALLKKEGENILVEKAKSEELIENGCHYFLPEYKDNGYRKHLRYLRTGLFTFEEGKADKKTKETKKKYSQAYAMTLDSSSFSNSVSFSMDDIRILKYLKGETIFLNDTENAEKGYVLVLLDKYPLGFALCDGKGTLKNMYNPGWRLN